MRNLPHEVLLKIRDHEGWLSRMDDGILSFDFPTCNRARVAMAEIGEVEGWTFDTGTCVLFCFPEEK